MGFLNSIEKIAFGDTFKKTEPEVSPSEGMYPEELEKLIKVALEDATITEKERRVLYKKAETLGVDPDELDMILESRLNAAKKNAAPAASEAPQPVVAKKKGPRKCPACGAQLLDSNMVYCPDCGFKVINVVKDILEEINAIVPPKKVKKEKRDSGLFGRLFEMNDSFHEEMEESHKIREQKENVILTFNVPNTKETVLEFLAFSVQKGAKRDPKYNYWEDDLGKAWYKKSEQVITTARQTFKQDAEFMSRLKDYAVRFGMEKKGLFW